MERILMCGCIIGNTEFPVRVGLGNDGFDGLFQMGRVGVVRRHDDGNERLVWIHGRIKSVGNIFFTLPYPVHIGDVLGVRTLHKIGMA